MPIEDKQPLTPDQQTVLDRVLAAREGKYLTLVREYDGVPVEMKFLPSLSIPALKIVAQVQRMSKLKDPDVLDQLGSLVDFVDVMATPETATMIGALLRSGVIDINEVADIQQRVVEVVSARPTTRPSSSADGSPEAGPTSTVSAQPEALTPPPFPSTGS